jgi:formylglycine-generating enzyme required for sulfatase activity
MGSDANNREAYDDEKPRHRVYLDAFYIDKYEVTNALYKRLMEATGRAAPAFWNEAKFNGASQPVGGEALADGGGVGEGGARAGRA